MSDMSMDEMIEVLARYRYNAKHDADRIKALEDELSRLRASSFVTAVPSEQYERVIKAGDEMHEQATNTFQPHSLRLAMEAWNAAKKGGQP
jgi:hypothetical protein